jgi:hypothetical protein
MASAQPGSRVHISKRDRQLATKSLRRLYLARFGQEGISDAVQGFTRPELVDVYRRNLQFWTDNTPELRPGVNSFTIAKHAICTNAVENLWKKIDEHGIRDAISPARQIGAKPAGGASDATPIVQGQGASLPAADRPRLAGALPAPD